MKPKTTRTLNPLPFHDLEPRRFEDLVRQLVYDFRLWKRLEPTGRGGSDDGLDIRGIEMVDLGADDSDDDDEAGVAPGDERLWIFQCKREKAIGPKQVRAYVVESLKPGEPIPHGFVFAAACDFSKKARDAFRDEVLARGVKEFHLWGKADLEDMLFQAKNDPLLFAYFGLSLQPQRRSERTRLRSVIATKKQIHALFKEAYASEGGDGEALVLVRDAKDTDYPDNPDGGRRPRWRICTVHGEDTPDGFFVYCGMYAAWVSPDRKTWDFVEGVDFYPDVALGSLQSRRSRVEERVDDADVEKAREFWSTYVPDRQQAWYEEFRVIPWERVLALDPHGDSSYPIPHLFVDFGREGDPFTESTYSRLRSASHNDHREMPRISKGNRAAFFPVPIPDEIFPPPEGIARVPTSLAKLGADIAQQVDETLKSVPSKEVPISPEPTPISEQDEERAKRAQRFGKWVEDIAAPVFSAFAEKLIALGHRAWMMPHGASPSDSGGLQYIELHVGILEPFPQKPDHHRAGHLGYSMDYWGKVTLNEFPGRQEPSRNRPEGGDGLKLVDLTPERVERDVLGVLNRLSTRPY